MRSGSDFAKFKASFRHVQSLYLGPNWHLLKANILSRLGQQISAGSCILWLYAFLRKEHLLKKYTFPVEFSLTTKTRGAITDAKTCTLSYVRVGNGSEILTLDVFGVTKRERKKLSTLLTRGKYWWLIRNDLQVIFSPLQELEPISYGTWNHGTRGGTDRVFHRRKKTKRKRYH